MVPRYPRTPENEPGRVTVDFKTAWQQAKSAPALSGLFRGFEFVPVAALFTPERRHSESCAPKRAFNGTDWRHRCFALFAERD